MHRDSHKSATPRAPPPRVSVTARSYAPHMPGTGPPYFRPVALLAPAEAVLGECASPAVLGERERAVLASYDKECVWS